jgi:tetratricopeptide (TPR) repeat protein
LIFYFLGLLAHEIAFILPLFLFYFLHYIKNIKLNESIKLVRIFVVVFTVYLYIRWNVLGLELRGGGYGAAGLAELNITLYQYIASLFQLISWYISKLIVPTNILFIWDVRLTDQISLFWTSLIVISLASFSVYNIKYKNNIIAFSTAVFISGFIPVLLASIAYASKTNTVFIEPHWFGFSSIGFFLLVASMLIWVRDKIDNKIWICMMFVMMIAMVTLTRNANTYWHDDETYCTFWLTENSLNGTAWKCKGISYYRKNDKGLHAENYKNCDELAYLGLSIHLFGNREQAYQYYFKAIEEDGNCALAYYGIALLYDGLIDEISQKNSQKFLYKARSISPNFYPIYQLIREGFANKMKKNQYQKIMLLWNEFNRPI